MPAPPARARRLSVQRLRLQAAYERRLARAITTALASQGRAVAARYLDGRKTSPSAYEVKVSINVMVPNADAELLRKVILPILQALMLDVSKYAGALVGGDAWVAGHPQLLALLASAGQRIARINEETRNIIRATLEAGSRAGYSPYQIAKGVEQDGFRGIAAAVASPARAQLIARTEVATAAQEAAHARYDQAGVTEVDIYDGDECGWTSHDDSDKANGTRRTLAAARAHPIAHPNCVRVSTPVLETRRRKAA